MIVVTHPWFMSCSVSSSHMRTCMALPSRMKWKMSSMARLCSPVVPCISPVVPCLAQHQVYHNHCWVLVRPGVLLPSRAQQPPAQNWTALTMLAFPRSARQLTSLVWQREHLQPPALSWSRGPGLKTCTTSALVPAVQGMVTGAV